MKDLILHNHIADKLSCLTSYDSNINVIDSYDIKKTPFCSLWIGNEDRATENEDEGGVIKVYECKQDFSIVYVGKMARRQDGSDEKTEEMDKIKSYIEFCLNKIERKKQFTIYDTLVTTEKQMDIYFEDLHIENIYKTYPDLNSQNISILYEGKIYYKQIDYL